jgi:hypothetical protein
MEDIQWSGGNQYGFMNVNGISFGPDLLAAGKVPNFISQVLSKNWHGLTLVAPWEPAAHLNILFHTHMEDIQWSGGNQYGFMTANAIRFCPDLLAKCQTFSQVLSKNWHGLTPVAPWEPAAHLNITYQTHMKDIQWSGGNQYGLMTANGISFGPDLLA